MNVYEDFRERNAGSWNGENFFEFIEKQWADFDYHIEDGENIAVATHGTALSTILNYYYPEFGFECFKKIVDFMPFIIRLDFDGENCVNHQVELIIHKEYNG